MTGPPAAPPGPVVVAGFDGSDTTGSPTAAAGVRELVPGDGAPFDAGRVALDLHEASDVAG